MSKVTGTTKFGWCMDSLHQQCWGSNRDQTCGCECHTKTKGKK